jgi:hypothetical protein
MLVGFVVVVGFRVVGGSRVVDRLRVVGGRLERCAVALEVLVVAALHGHIVPDPGRDRRRSRPRSFMTWSGLPSGTNRCARCQVRSGAMAAQESSGPAFGANSWLVEEMYEQYRADPDSVGESWREFFED